MFVCSLNRIYFCCYQKEDDEILPLGWKKCYDEDGAYYWHVRTGTIQRGRPEASDGDTEVSFELFVW